MGMEKSKETVYEQLGQMKHKKKAVTMNIFGLLLLTRSHYSVFREPACASENVHESHIFLKLSTTDCVQFHQAVTLRIQVKSVQEWTSTSDWTNIRKVIILHGSGQMLFPLLGAYIHIGQGLSTRGMCAPRGTWEAPRGYTAAAQRSRGYFQLCRWHFLVCHRRFWFHCCAWGIPPPPAQWSATEGTPPQLVNQLLGVHQPRKVENPWQAFQHDSVLYRSSPCEAINDCTFIVCPNSSHKPSHNKQYWAEGSISLLHDFCPLQRLKQGGRTALKCLISRIIYGH